MESTNLMDKREIKENVAKEVQLSTELLAEAGVDEPTTFKLVKTKTFLKTYLLANLISSLLIFFLVDTRTKMFYLVKLGLNGSGMYALEKKSTTLFTMFAVAFGISTVLWSGPVLAGVMVLFSKDICSVLAGASPSNSSEFLRYCHQNLNTIRMVGAGVLASELLVDAIVFVQIVKYQRYLKNIASERLVLQKYQGKERIALP